MYEIKGGVKGIQVSDSKCLSTKKGADTASCILISWVKQKRIEAGTIKWRRERQDGSKVPQKLPRVSFWEKHNERVFFL